MQVVRGGGGGTVEFLGWGMQGNSYVFFQSPYGASAVHTAGQCVLRSFWPPYTTCKHAASYCRAVTCHLHGCRVL